MLPAIQVSFSHPHSGLLGRILPPLPSHLISCRQGIWVLWEVSFPAALAVCGSLCKRKDILLILVINPLGISETGAKIVRKVQDAPAFTTPSLPDSHCFQSSFFFSKSKKYGRWNMD